MKIGDLPAHHQVLAESLRDPVVRAEWERLALAHSVALRVMQYRAEHQLSQSALARMLGMQQSAIARLEAGEHTPSLDTLIRLSRGLGITFHIKITPDTAALTA